MRLYSFYANNRMVILPQLKPPNPRLATLDTQTMPEFYFKEATTNYSNRAHSPARIVLHDATKTFTDRVGPKALSLVHTLEIISPLVGMEMDFPRETPACKEWLVTVDYLKELADTRSLTLIIYISTPQPECNWSFEDAVRTLETPAPQLLSPSKHRCVRN